MPADSTPTLEFGRPEPLGAQARDDGVNFAVACTRAEAMDLCLFDEAGKERRLRLFGPVDGICHGFVPGARPGLLYGFRARGAQLDPAQLLLDPQAREIVGDPPARKARVAAATGEAPGRRNRPRHRDEDLLLYQLHARGFSMLHPDIPPELRGRFGALAHPAAIAHFRALGVSSLSLLPVQQGEAGALDYWGFGTLGFFAADPRFASEPTAAARDFQAMVHALHEHGIEVLLDIACERLPARSRCEPGGDAPAIAQPDTLRFVLDALRFWMHDMGVDGFRFHGAVELGRAGAGFDPQAAFFAALRQDPVLAGARLIADPGAALGRFPGRWQEWNARFRDAVRGYWLRRGVARAEFARRFTGSEDLFQASGRAPTASVNFLCSHEGFTLADVVSFARKHNEANVDGNRDGRDDEPSHNFGIEGPTEDRLVSSVRRRTRRAMMATLLLAQGTPMLRAGDEFGNSQRGNNHAWCQDNPIGWLDWQEADATFQQFVAEAAALRGSEPLLHPARWLAQAGGPAQGASISWRLPGGAEPGAPDWQDASAQALACLVDSGFDLPAEGSAKLLLLFNAEAQEVAFTLPEGYWTLALDSSGVLARRQGALPRELAVPAHTLVVLRPPPNLRHRNAARA